MCSKHTRADDVALEPMRGLYLDWVEEFHKTRYETLREALDNHEGAEVEYRGFRGGLRVAKKNMLGALEWT